MLQKIQYEGDVIVQGQTEINVGYMTSDHESFVDFPERECFSDGEISGWGFRRTSTAMGFGRRGSALSMNSEDDPHGIYRQNSAPSAFFENRRGSYNTGIMSPRSVHTSHYDHGPILVYHDGTANGQIIEAPLVINEGDIQDVLFFNPAQWSPAIWEGGGLVEEEPDWVPPDEERVDVPDDYEPDFGQNAVQGDDYRSTTMPEQRPSTSMALPVANRRGSASSRRSSVGSESPAISPRAGDNAGRPSMQINLQSSSQMFGRESHEGPIIVRHVVRSDSKGDGETPQGTVGGLTLLVPTLKSRSGTFEEIEEEGESPGMNSLQSGDSPQKKLRTYIHFFSTRTISFKTNNQQKSKHDFLNDNVYDLIS